MMFPFGFEVSVRIATPGNGESWVDPILKAIVKGLVRRRVVLGCLAFSKSPENLCVERHESPCRLAGQQSARPRV
jgi:hypothetical protein